MNKRVLCIWLPNWPIQRIQIAEPQLASRAVVLQTRDSRRGLVIVAANRAARQQGVRPGMSLSEATALAPLEIRRHQSHEDLDQLCDLCEQAQQFSPIVGMEQLDRHIWFGRTLYQPESMLLDISGIAGLFGGESMMLHQICKWLHTQGILSSMAVADTIGAAWAVANYGYRLPQARSNPGLLTLNLPRSDEDPDGSHPGGIEAPFQTFRVLNAAAGDDDQAHSLVHIVPVGQGIQAVTPLMVAALRIPTETVQTLERLGIRTIAQLRQLPRAGLATRLGQQLLDRWDQAAGEQDEPIRVLHAAPEWSIEMTLEFPTVHRETLLEIVSRLCHQLVQRLSARGEGALRLVARLDLVESAPLILQLGLFRPTADAEHLSSLLMGQLETQLSRQAIQPLWRLALHATLTAPLVWKQSDLFDGDAVESRLQLARLVDRLSSRLGRGNVLRAKVEREPQPEQAITWHTMTGRRPDGAEQETLKKLSSRLARRRAEPSSDDPLRRPTRLLNPPVELHAVSLENDGLLGQFLYQGQVYRVVRQWGPERLESGWWHGPSVRREYYRVESEHHAWWWIFRDMASNCWFLHGIFD